MHIVASQEGKVSLNMDADRVATNHTDTVIASALMLQPGIVPRQLQARVPMVHCVTLIAVKIAYFLYCRLSPVLFR